MYKNTNQSNILIQNLEYINFEITNTPVLVWGSGGVFLPRVFQERDCSPPSQMSCSTFGRSWGVIDNYRRNLLDNGVGNWFLRLHDGADQVDPSQLRVVGKANISDWWQSRGSNGFQVLRLGELNGNRSSTIFWYFQWDEVRRWGEMFSSLSLWVSGN